MDKFDFLTYFTLLLVVALPSFVAWNGNGHPLGQDWVYHLEYAKEYVSAGLNPGLLLNVFLNSPNNAANNGPYPFLFHFGIAVSYLFSRENSFGLFWQMAGYALTCSIVWLLVSREKGNRTALIALILLAGSVANFDRNAQATPQAIDAVFFPLAILVYSFKKRELNWLVSLLLIAMVFSHGFYSLLLITSLALYYLIGKYFGKVDQPNLKSILKWTFVLSLPIILVSLAYLPGQLSSYLPHVHNAQETTVKSNLAFDLWYLGIGIAVLTIPAALSLINRVRLRKFKNFDLLYLSWLGCLTPLIFIFPDRWFSYAAIPLSIICADWVIKNLQEKVHFTLAVILLILFFITNWVTWIIPLLHL